MKPLSLITLACFLCSAVAASELNQGYSKQSLIEPGKSYEACLKLSPGDRLHYVFSSASGLRFNIRYHDGEQVL
jgi:hypothetical protein